MFLFENVLENAIFVVVLVAVIVAIVVVATLIYNPSSSSRGSAELSWVERV